MVPSLRPEIELLVCVASPSVSGSRAERIQRLVANNLNWENVLAMAHRHSVVPLLFQQLCDAALAGVPEHVMARLRNRNEENVRQSIWLVAELFKLLDQLRAAGIRAVPFKGPTLALSAYGDIGLRQFGDLDILVKRQDVLQVKDLLATHGFKSTPLLTHAQEAALLRFDCAYNFVNEAGVMVDVHWNFAPRYLSLPLDLDRLWRRLEALTLNGRELPSLAAIDLLPALCVHGATHFWERLNWIADVAGLIVRNKNLDWQELLAEARAGGNTRALALGLFLAHDLLGAPLPEEVWQAVRKDAVVREVGAQVKQQLCAPLAVRSGVSEGRLHLKLKERRRDKLKSAIRLSLTPRNFDWMFLSLPAALTVFYYPLRPLRLAAKYALRVVSGVPASAAKKNGQPPAVR
jgi:hypothetical protein